MKNKFIKSALLVSVTIILFQGCKKGDNDPFISFRSRNARITGDWVTSKIESTNVETTYTASTGNITVKTTTETLDGAIVTKNVSTINAGITTPSPSTTSSLSQEFTFNKNGTYTSRVVSDGIVSEKSDTWLWLDNGKSKSELLFGSQIFKIDELKEKEMVLIFEMYQKETTNASGDYSEGKATYKITLTKK